MSRSEIDAFIDGVFSEGSRLDTLTRAEHVARIDTLLREAAARLEARHPATATGVGSHAGWLALMVYGTDREWVQRLCTEGERTDNAHYRRASELIETLRMRYRAQQAGMEP